MEASPTTHRGRAAGPGRQATGPFIAKSPTGRVFFACLMHRVQIRQTPVRGHPYPLSLTKPPTKPTGPRWPGQPCIGTVAATELFGSKLEGPDGRNELDRLDPCPLRHQQCRLDDGSLGASQRRKAALQNALFTV